MSVLERCPSCRESIKGNKERQGPFLGVRFKEMSVKGDSTVQCFFCSIFVKTLDETTHIQFQIEVFNLLPRLYLRLIKIFCCIYVLVHSYSWTFIFGGMTMYDNGFKA